MRLRPFVLVLMLGICPAAATAQDFGVLESAETIDRGNFKFKVNPMLIFGEDGADSRGGLTLLAGYGFTRRFDVEGGVALYSGITIVGATAEAWLVRDRQIDVSAAAGLHFRRGDETPDTTAFDFTVIASKHVAPRLEIYGAFDSAFESIDNPGSGSFKTFHLIPGIEYRLATDLDLVAEVGIGLNDAARHYFGAGLAYYFR